MARAAWSYSSSQESGRQRADAAVVPTREKTIENEMTELAVPTFGEPVDGSNPREAKIDNPLAFSNSKRELERRLDQALMDTFPASDPVSIVISAGR